MIHDFLNIRYSLRKLSDEQFVEILPTLAKELESVNFEITYNEDLLVRDWNNLVKWNAMGNTIASTHRVGMKLCEHFFPNFYNIEDNKGRSFRSLWKADVLEKVLRWNRSSHSTPYMSELRRGIYFTTGLPKSTMYRPQMSKMIIDNLGGKHVLDPCAGWGGRMLGAIAAGATTYTAFEPNTETYNGNLELYTFLKTLGISTEVILIKDSALNMHKYNLHNMNIVLTSPPYFDLEIYSHEETQSVNGHATYTSWVNGFLNPLIESSISTLTPRGWSCWNVHNIGKMRMIDDVAKCHGDAQDIKTFSITSSRRQTNQNSTKNMKNSDMTICYQI